MSRSSHKKQRKRSLMSFSSSTSRKLRCSAICKPSNRTWLRPWRNTSKRFQISGAHARISKKRWERTERDERYEIDSAEKAPASSGDTTHADRHVQNRASGNRIGACDDERWMLQRPTTEPNFSLAAGHHN